MNPKFPKGAKVKFNTHGIQHYGEVDHFFEGDYWILIGDNVLKCVPEKEVWPASFDTKKSWAWQKMLQMIRGVV